MIDVRDLIREKVGEPFGVYYTTGEGRFLPNGDEESSGCVVAYDGREYSFWTGWRDGRVVLKEWRQIRPDPDTWDDPEYRAARKAAGC